MKKIPFKMQLAAVILVLGAAFLGFQAQVRSAGDEKAAVSTEAASFKMAVVDVKVLLSQSDAAKSIQTQMGEENKKLQKDASEQEQKLKEMEKALIASNGKGSEADFNKKKAELEKSVIEARTMLQTKRRSLEKAARNAVESLRAEITKIVAEKANQEKYDIVLTRQNVVLAVTSMEITGDVMAQLNKKVKKIDLKVEVN